MSPSTRRKTGSKRVVFEDTYAAMIAPSRALGYLMESPTRLRTTRSAYCRVSRRIWSAARGSALGHQRRRNPKASARLSDNRSSRHSDSGFGGLPQ